MRISELETFVVGNPPPHYGGRYWIFLKLTTDGGIAGYGEAYAPPFHPRVVVAMIEDVFARHVLGADPFGIERLSRLIHASGYGQRADLSLMAVLSAVEMACWDIVGKALERPVHALLGGRVHERLRSYSYLYPEPGDAGDVYKDADLAAARAAEYVARGFTAVKFDPVTPYSAFDPRQLSLEALARAESFCARLRQAVGGACDLLFGTHGQMTAAAAIRLARRLEAYDPLWLEEPVPPENADEMAKVARATSIPVAAGERLAGKHEFARLLAAGVAVLQPNLGRVGGILEAKKIAGMAEAHYAQIAPHLYCGPIVGAASIQLGLTCPNFLIQEGIGTWDGFHAEILKTPIRWEAGYIIPPDAPGLGVELDEAVARAHAYEGEDLHLEMQATPVGLDE